MFLVPENDILFYENISSLIHKYERYRREWEEGGKSIIKQKEILERENGRLKSELESREMSFEKERLNTFKDISKSLELTPEEVRRAFERGRYDRLAEENPWKDIPLTLPKNRKVSEKQKVWIEKMLESQLNDKKPEHSWMVAASREVGKDRFISKMKNEIVYSIEAKADSCAEVEKIAVDEEFLKTTSKIAGKFHSAGNLFSRIWNIQNQIETETDLSR